MFKTCYVQVYFARCWYTKLLFISDSFSKYFWGFAMHWALAWVLGTELKNIQTRYLLLQIFSSSNNDQSRGETDHDDELDGDISWPGYFRHNATAKE